MIKEAKKSKICSIVTMGLCALISVCFFLPLLKLDLSPVTGSIYRFFTDHSVWQEGLKYSTFTIVKEVWKYRNEIGKYYWLFMVCGLAPYFFALVVFVLSWLRGRWKYITNLILSGTGFLITFCAHKVFIPLGVKNGLEELVDDSIAGDILDIFHVESLTDIFAKEASKVYSGSLSLSFYFLLTLFFLMVVVSVIGLVLYRKAADIAGETAALIGLDGIFKGAVISIEKNEELIIGRDPAQCNIIIEAEEISRKHCIVSFDSITGQYRVTDYSSNGTFINNERRIMRNQPQFVKRGEVIYVGGEKNRFQLY